MRFWDIEVSTNEIVSKKHFLKGKANFDTYHNFSSRRIKFLIIMQECQIMRNASRLRSTYIQTVEELKNTMKNNNCARYTFNVLMNDFEKLIAESNFLSY